MQSTPERLKAQCAHPHYFDASLNEDALRAVESAESIFTLSKACSTQAYFPRSKQHYLLLLAELKDSLVGEILDVGSRDDTFSVLSGRTIRGVDKNNPELPDFDWEKEPLPYEDRSFDTLVCFDTLEHIDRTHYALDDLFRVAKSSVVVSLPNCWKKAVKGILKGWWGTASYGIPPIPPFDRHRWFFNTEEAFAFLVYRAHLAGWEPKAVRYHTPRITLWQRVLYPWIFSVIPARYGKNWLTETLFVSFVPKGSKG